MNSPTCPKCDCVKGCQSNPTACPILLAECIASGQVSAYQIEQHRVFDAAIAQPEHPAPVRQPLTHTEIVNLWATAVSSWIEVKQNPYTLFARSIEAAHGITTPKETT